MTPRLLASTTSHKKEPLLPTLEVFACLGLRDLDLNLHHFIEAGTPDARYAILELADGAWRVTFRHVPYDHEAMAALARQNGQPELASALATGWIK